MDAIPQSVLNAPVEGVNLSGQTFAEQLHPSQATLLVFLRHFG
jgi:hypothetical protein